MDWDTWYMTKRQFTDGRLRVLLALIAIAGVLSNHAVAGTHLTRGRGVNNTSKRRQVVEPVEPPLKSVPSKPIVTAEGSTPSIELNVDTVTPDARLSIYTYGTNVNVKASFGNRFTLAEGQTPFSLKAVAGLFTQTTDGTGFEIGNTIGITVFVDASSSGQITNAIPVYNGQATLPDIDTLVSFTLPEPIVAHQGDIYIIFTDFGTDPEDTAIPVIQANHGGSTDPRSFASLNIGGSPNPLSTSSYFPLTDSQIVGNCVVRGYGDLAEPFAPVTGGGELVDAQVPAPTQLTASAASGVLLQWTPAVLDPLPPPQLLGEIEPNDGPATAQVIGQNVQVSGMASSLEDGAPGGFGEDVEDWYKVTIPEATSISIDLTGFGATDFDLLLYEDGPGPFESADAIAVSGRAAGEEEHISLLTIPSGTYLIAVSAFDPEVPQVTPYTLTVAVGPRVSRYNVYCANAPDFQPSAANFIGAVSANLSSVVIHQPPGQFFRLTTVVRDKQSLPSNTAHVTGVFNICARDDASGDAFRAFVGSRTLQTNGSWEYRTAAGQVFCGVAEMVSYQPGRSLVMTDRTPNPTDCSRASMTVQIDFVRRIAIVQLVDRQSGRTYTLRDRNIADSSCDVF